MGNTVQKINGEGLRIIFASIGVQICLGALYSWGVFVNPLMAEFGASKTRVSVTFTITLVFYVFGVLIGGQWQDKTAPRQVITVSGLVLASGYFIAAISQSLEGIYLGYGVLAGLGIGIGYGTPIAVCTKWFPTRKGLAVGSTVAGFGAGSLLFSPLAVYLCNTFGWRVAFGVLGVTLGAIVIIAGQLLKNPQSGGAFRISPVNTGDVRWMQLLGSHLFWMFWIVFALSTGAGLFFISHLPGYLGQFGLDPSSSAWLLGLLSICNGIGRIGWGFFSDRIGKVISLRLILVQMGMAMFILSGVTSLLALVVMIMLIGVSFGGVMAIYPALTADFFGSENLGTNYGLMFTGYGIGGVMGPTLGAFVFDRYHNYSLSLIIAGVFCSLALLLIAVVYKQLATGEVRRGL